MLSEVPEVPELVGAERLRAARAVTPEVGRRFVKTITDFERFGRSARPRHQGGAADPRQHRGRADDDRGEVVVSGEEGGERAGDGGA